MQLKKTDVVREICGRSLASFVKRAWHVIEPSTPLVWSWHMDAICEHLEAVTRGEINRLLINVPPGTSKSTLVNIFWPAWEWAIGYKHYKIISASHEQGLATRDTRKMRNLIVSDWFQSMWDIEIVGDQNQKTYYENDGTGFRQACAVTSMTGRRGDRVIWDDPHSVESAISETKRQTAIREFTETLPSRFISPKDSAMVIVMQRVHEDDVSGYILSNDLGYEHLCLPMEFEPERKCVTSIGFEDPRTKDGELLMPDRFPIDVIERDKKVMGSVAYAGQYQQRPAPREGGFFDVDSIKIIREAPKCVDYVRFWDKAGTQDGGDQTAGVLMGRTADNQYVIIDVVVGRWSSLKREQKIQQCAHLDGKTVKIRMEQEPGSSGKDSAEHSIRMLAGYNVKAVPATGSKDLRADPLAVQIEAGNVMMVKGEWNKPYLDELRMFPNGKHDDQVDASSGAFNEVARNKPKPSVHFI